MQVYKASKKVEDINKLGEQEWYVTNESPMIISHEFVMPWDAPILDQFKDYFKVAFNQHEQQRRYLENLGYKATLIKRDDGQDYYELEKNCPELVNWRIEFNYQDDESVVYITFGNNAVNTPAFVDMKVIDKYVPKEILEKALASSSIYVGEMKVDAD